MNKSILKNTFAGIGATVVALSIGYFGIQYIGRYTMLAIGGSMIGLSAVAYLTEKWLSSQQSLSKTPVVNQLQPKSIYQKKVKKEHYTPKNQNDTTVNSHLIVVDSRLFKAGVNITKATSISKPYGYCRRRLVICHRARVKSSTKTFPTS
jgi:Na+-translocating ferredoxin:NAD+ oxidoreductase RnfG subunit